VSFSITFMHIVHKINPLLKRLFLRALISPELITVFHLDMKFESLSEFYFYLKSDFLSGLEGHVSVAVLVLITILNMVNHLCIGKMCNVNSCVVHKKKVLIFQPVG
jgi:hypothetical protein